MLNEDEKKQAHIEALKGKLAQLEEREAILDQICKLKHEISKAWQMGDISVAQKLFNQAWEMERSYKNHPNEQDSLSVTKESILKMARSMGLR